MIFQKCTLKKKTKSQNYEGNANFSVAPKSKSTFVKIKKSTHPLLKTDGFLKMYICFCYFEGRFSRNVHFWRIKKVLRHFFEKVHWLNSKKYISEKSPCIYTSVTGNLKHCVCLAGRVSTGIMLKPCALSVC